MEEKITAYTSNESESDPYIDDLADYLYDKFKDHPQSYMEQHFAEAVSDYIINKMDIKYIGKINISGFEQALREAQIITPDAREKGLSKIDVSESLKSDTSQKVSAGINC